MKESFTVEEDSVEVRHNLTLNAATEGINMPVIRNISRGLMILEHVTDEPIVLKQNESVEVPREALSIPLIRHYIEVKKLDLVSLQTKQSDVILTR